MNRTSRKYNRDSSIRGLRAGVTLTEVLMSLLIMSIGVVSLVTLFPISATRVIEATNMTNATVLRYNAESCVDAQPPMIFDPDGNSNTQEHRGQSYIVDPLGYTVFQTINATPGVFGYDPSSVTLSLPVRYLGLPSITSEDRARQLVASADTFTEQGDGRAVASTSNSAVLDPNVDLSSLINPSNGSIISYEDRNLNGSLDPGEDLNGNGVLDSIVVRAFIFDAIGDRSEVRNLATISPTPPHTLTWNDNLPSNFGSVGRVMVATGEEYYTWMLSVRMGTSGAAKVDVVVFVKRQITQEAERVYEGILAPGATTENHSVVVTFTDPTNPNDDGSKLRRGGYIFDTKNCLWYRISSIESSTTTSKTLVLEQPIRRDNTGGGIIAFPNVVGVFPLDLKYP